MQVLVSRLYPFLNNTRIHSGFHTPSFRHIVSAKGLSTLQSSEEQNSLCFRQMQTSLHCKRMA